jgi:uncharacterized protein YqfA (UPF0365 family)
LPLTIDDLSTHYLAGGNVQMVVLALIAAKKAAINLPFDRACAIDLATKGTSKTVLEAEAQIPIAIAGAFEKGHLGIMDYYRIRNVQADTTMRENIGGQGPDAPSSSSPPTKK